MIPFEHASAIEQLAKAIPVEAEGWGTDQTWKPCQDQKLYLTLVEDSAVGQRDERIATLTKEAAASTTRWCEEYNKRIAAEKERDAAKKALEEIKAKVAS